MQILINVQINVHLLVNERCECQNALCNDKNCLKLITPSFKYVTIFTSSCDSTDCTFVSQCKESTRIPLLSSGTAKREFLQTTVILKPRKVEAIGKSVWRTEQQYGCEEHNSILPTMWFVLHKSLQRTQMWIQKGKKSSVIYKSNRRKQKHKA